MSVPKFRGRGDTVYNLFFLDTRFIRTPEKTPTTPLIERGAKTPGKRERTNLPN